MAPFPTFGRRGVCARCPSLLLVDLPDREEHPLLVDRILNVKFVPPVTLSSVRLSSVLLSSVVLSSVCDGEVVVSADDDMDDTLAAKMAATRSAWRTSSSENVFKTPGRREEVPLSLMAIFSSDGDAILLLLFAADILLFVVVYVDDDFFCSGGCCRSGQDDRGDAKSSFPSFILVTLL